MTTDRQKICKCGANVAEFLNDINTFEGNLRRIKEEGKKIELIFVNMEQNR